MANLERLLGSSPTNAWLLIGDEKSFPTARALRDMHHAGNAVAGIWTGARQTQPGDLLLFYFMHPRRAIHFAARAMSYPFFDSSIEVSSTRDVDPHQWWVEYSPLVELQPFPLDELRELMGGHLILRGKSGRYLPPDVVRGVLGRARNRGRANRAESQVLQVPVGSEQLRDPAEMTFDDWREMADGLFELEVQVEQYLVEPLLRLCLPRRNSVRWQKSYAIGSGVPDYVILESGQPRSVIEVKLGVRLPHDGDWSRSPDFQQVSRYAAELDVPAALVDSNKIFLIERGATAPMAMIERRRASREDLQTIGMHLIGSPVAPPPSGPPEPRPRTPKQPKPANRGAAPRRSEQSNARVTGRTSSSSASEARHILLTWNPGPGNDEQWMPEEWQDHVARIRSGDRITGNWSVSNRRHNIEPGDIGYLFRQGSHGRGIVAAGEILSEPYKDTHWTGVGVTNYVDIEWTEAMDLDAFITLEILEADVPSFPWRKVYSSGREVSGQAAKELETLMASTLGYEPEA